MIYNINNQTDSIFLINDGSKNTYSINQNNNNNYAQIQVDNSQFTYNSLNKPNNSFGDKSKNSKLNKNSSQLKFDNEINPDDLPKFKKYDKNDLKFKELVPKDNDKF